MCLAAVVFIHYVSSTVMLPAPSLVPCIRLVKQPGVPDARGNRRSASVENEGSVEIPDNMRLLLGCVC